MTCLVDRVLSGAGMKLHPSMLGTFFVYRPGQPNQDFFKTAIFMIYIKLIKVCDIFPVPLRTLPAKQVIVALY